MKFGVRTPSLSRRFAARTSWKRYARHSLGLKAPRGAGWFTNPRRAAYNRVYNRTTVSVDRLARTPKRRARSTAAAQKRKAGCGRLLLCFVLPPLAVIDKGTFPIFLTTVLTVLGWIPGVFAALLYNA